MRKQALNVVGLTAGDAGARFVGFLVTVYLARILAPSAYGLISIGLALLGQLSLLSSPGVQMVEARNVASGAGGSRERTGTVLGMRLLLAGGLWCFTTVVLTLLPAFAPIRTLLTLFAASLVPLAAMMDWYFQGREQGLLAGGARLLQSIVYGIFLMMLVHSADDLTNVPLALFIGNAAAAGILLIVFVGLEGMPRVRWDPAGWRKVFVENASVGLAVAMGQLVINFPPVAIGWLRGTAEAGLWGAAMKLVFLILILDRVLNAALLPPMTRILSRREGDVQAVVDLIYRVVAAAILPVAFVGAVLAPPAVALVFGAEYAGAAWMLSALMVYVVLTLVNSVFVCAMIGGRRERQYSRRMILGSIVLVVSVTVLTLAAGTPGTVAGVLVGEATTLGLMMSGLSRTLGLRVRPFQKDLLAGFVVLVAAVLLFRDPLLQMLVGVGGYGLVLGLFRSFPSATLRELRRRLT
jgi:polysaccharide transporter, PST family